MKLSEMIHALQECEKMHGDIGVEIALGTAATPQGNTLTSAGPFWFNHNGYEDGSFTIGIRDFAY